MLKFGNKEFRNLQEQVLKNMQDINSLKEGTAVLDEFGIKVVGEVDSLADLPTVAEYKEAHEDWAYGDAYAVGTEAPYTLYILTRENETTTEDHWFDIGEFPAPGPQGEAGPEGPIGPQGQTGNPGTDGASAGFGTITATAQTLVPGSSATATVVASGPDTAKSFAFTFGIPRGQKGEAGGVTDVLINDESVVYDGIADIHLTDYVDLTSNQTITGDKTFTTGIILDRPGTTGNSKWRIVENQNGQLAFNRYHGNTWIMDFMFTPSTITSYTAAALGSKTTPFSDIYFDGILSDCNNTDYGLVLPDTTNFTDNKTLATTDEIPTATSDLTNDSGFITSSALSSYATITYVDDELAEKTDLDLIAPRYSNLRGYVVGDKVIYEGQLYTCNTAITTAEEFNSSHWTWIKVSEGFVDLDGTQTISGAKTFGSNILPATDGTLDLGSSSSKWQHLYLGGGVIWGSSYITQQNNNIVINPAGTSVVAKMDNQKDLGAISKR